MKTFAYVLAILLLAFSFTGCASDPYARDTLIEIPNYPAHAREYDKSANLAVYTTIPIAHTLARHLKNAGYTLFKPEDAYMSAFSAPDWILEPLYLIPSRITYNEETYLYARVVVSVRPAYNYSEAYAALLPNEARIFQAHAQHNCGQKDEITSADYNAVYEKAVINLLYNPAFCEAIEKKK